MASRTEKSPDKKPNYQEIVTRKLIEELEKGTAPWQKPWDTTGFLPYNPVSGTRYRGSNLLWLMVQNRPDARWMTYKQAEKLGAQVRKGEKGTQVQYWKFHQEMEKRDENGNTVLDKNGKPVKVTVPLDRPVVFSAYVFNAAQIDGLPPPEKKEQLFGPILNVRKKY